MTTIGEEMLENGDIKISKKVRSEQFFDGINKR